MTAEHNINDTGFFSQLLKKAVVIDRNNSEFYLNCVPFGFRMRYSIHKYNRGHQYDVSIDCIFRFVSALKPFILCVDSAETVRVKRSN